MKYTDTKQKILLESVRLFAKCGYGAVSVGMIAEAAGIKPPSLYKHYKSKQDIFNSILKEMERRDAENAEEFSMPVETKENNPQAYGNISAGNFAKYCKKMFLYWTKDDFASSFRKMLTLEQYRSKKMNALYNQYLCTGPLKYTEDLLGSAEKALELYAPMFMLYYAYDSTNNKKKAMKMLETHLKNWEQKNNVKIR